MRITITMIPMQLDRITISPTITMVLKVGIIAGTLGTADSTPEPAYSLECLMEIGDSDTDIHISVGALTLTIHSTDGASVMDIMIHSTTHFSTLLGALASITHGLEPMVGTIHGEAIHGTMDL